MCALLANIDLTIGENILDEYKYFTPRGLDIHDV